MLNRKLVKAVKALFNGKPSSATARDRNRRAARTNRKLVRAVNNLTKPIGRLSRAVTKYARRTTRLLPTLLAAEQRRGEASSGFVLPTVVMVILVVTLLTTAIVFRAFNRSENASNFRVNQAVFNAAAPAIDRARVKVDQLLADPTLPRATPTDIALDNAITGSTASIRKYTFGDETPLKLGFDIDGNGSVDSPTVSTALESKEIIKTAWKFPVDTNNNGSYDTYTLYGIYFRSPSRNFNSGNNFGLFTRARNPLETRTPPMDDSTGSGICAAAQGTSASLVGNSSWYKSGAILKKSFFVYTANVPITKKQIADESLDLTKYEAYPGNKSFSALEYQRDEKRVPLSNNAVVYEDDLEITPGAGLNLNGRIVTNSNLLTATTNLPIRLYQVSSQDSCYYQEENSKVIVGGNVVNGGPQDTGPRQSISLDLYRASAQPQTGSFGGGNQSVTNPPNVTAYNSQLYTGRINTLVQAWITGNPPGPTTGYSPNDPTDVKNTVGGITDPTIDKAVERQKAIESYFRDRTRRVPYTDPDTTLPSPKTPQGTGDALRPPDEWMYPTDPTDGRTGSVYTGLTLNGSGNKLLPAATDPDKQKDLGQEVEIGDHILVGNNLPAKWCKDTASCNAGTFVTDSEKQNISSTVWDGPQGDTTTRYRTTRVAPLSDLGDTARDGFWETNAKERLANEPPYSNVGGLRIVTGAGIYLPFNDVITPAPPAANAPSTVVWPDTMPVLINTATDQPITPDPIPQDALTKRRPFLKMRATVVYHYQYQNGGRPIACVSSYYDPTDQFAWKNANTFRGQSLPWTPPDDTGVTTPSAPYGRSNNGITYSPPTSTYALLQTDIAYQASLYYPNGRLVNQLLQDAVAKNGIGLSPSEQAAVDSTLCAFDILRGTITPTTTPTTGFNLPHGTIYERSFLDAREIKNIDNSYDPADPNNRRGLDTYTTVGSATLTGNYDLDIEQRQPLEVRTTILDLHQLGGGAPGTPVSSSPVNEYLFPNSGIIYATRDDALPDLSAPLPGGLPRTKGKEQTQRLNSAVDFRLDPTRRPNGIMLTNGSQLGREVNYRQEEKGLILASNLPVYVKGQFNLHTHEEFTTQLVNPNTLQVDWSNFYNRSKANVDPDFACRKNDPRINCQNGDPWRPATVIADTVTLLSDYNPTTRGGFRFGYRSDGDYDLRNHEIDNIAQPDTTLPPNTNQIDTAATVATNRLTRGFWNSNFVTSRAFTDTDYSGNVSPAPQPSSSYFNNFVNPVQRRENFNEYLMEVCRNRLVTQCRPQDWYYITPDPTVSNDPGTRAGTAVNLSTTPTAGSSPNSIVVVAGTTASPATVVQPTNALYRVDRAYYPRRIAFLRNASYQLQLDGNNQPIPLRITGTGAGTVASSGTARRTPNALWYLTTTDTANPPTNSGTDADRSLYYLTAVPANSTAQPQLVPVLQIQATDSNPGSRIPSGNNLASTNWMPKGQQTRFNLVSAAGDSPPRPNPAESGGGLGNFVRFLENWSTGGNSPATPVGISGSFIQFRHSAYATAPFQALVGTIRTAGNTFTPNQQSYQTASGPFRQPYYEAPSRQWGFDVGLLSQLPDLFAQRFTTKSAGPANEYFREVARDDQWIQTLLCADRGDTGIPAVSADQRPSNCKNIP